MKKLLVIATVVAGAYGASAQGLISFNNTSSANSKISVNSVVGGPATGLTSGAAGSFLYELFYAPSGVTTVGGSAAPVIPTGPGAQLGFYAFSDSNWKDGLASATNSATVGRVSGSTAQVVTGVGKAASANFVIIGWSSAIGSTIGSLQALLNTGGAPVTGWYVGESSVNAITLGDGSSVPTPNALSGSSIPGFTLGLIPQVPEPTTIALGVIGGLSLLGLRRKKA
jgi:hypothetical protein